jgi:adenine C2-methylase RlmN of 23S rRNA A2503 and tRNA A37
MEENIIIKRLVSSDGETKKFLFKLVDGQTVESVLMKCKHGHTICVSSWLQNELCFLCNRKRWLFEKLNTR